MVPPLTKPARGTLSHTLPLDDTVYSVAWSPDGTYLAAASNAQGVQVWDAASGTDQSVQVWSLNSSAPLTVYSGHKDSVNAVAWSSDGRHLASGSDDKTVRVWDLSPNGNPYVYQGHTNIVYTVAWSPGGFPWPWSHEEQRLASGGQDMTVRLWQAI